MNQMRELCNNVFSFYLVIFVFYVLSTVICLVVDLKLEA